jgi:hypothetical protein
MTWLLIASELWSPPRKGGKMRVRQKVLGISVGDPIGTRRSTPVGYPVTPLTGLVGSI